MPDLAPRPCSGGCGRLVKRGKCDECNAKYHKRIDSQRGTAHQRGYTAEWARYSRAFRRRFPLCGQGPRWSDDSPSADGCLSRERFTAAQHVDHITPVNHGGDFWDQMNHQSLCAACHSAKTMRESVNQ